MAEINAQQLNEAANQLKEKFPGKGFALIVFDFGDQLREFRYISNAQRQDMIGALEAVLQKWKTFDEKGN